MRAVSLPYLKSSIQRAVSRLSGCSFSIYTVLLFAGAVFSQAAAEPTELRAETVVAEPVRPVYQRNSAFIVPEKMRGRVNFWKDIFAKYGKSQFVIHHRRYPQIVFMTVDLSKEFAQMDPISFSRLKASSEKQYVGEVKEAIEFLAAGNQAQTYLQKFISSKMQILGPGTAKYRVILDEDLIRTQTGIKEKFADSIKRSGRYLPLIEKIFVEDYGLPVELTRIPFIESSFDYTAYSSVGAAGIWQFMPRTAKVYMKVNSAVDERRDPLEASKAAAKYLRSAYARLGNWPLAITSYNHGVAGVAGKVAKMGTSDLATLIEHRSEQVFGFASNNFFPEFVAALEVYDNRRHYFPNLQVDKPIHAREVEIAKPIAINSVLSQVGVSREELKEVNYAISKAVWDGRLKLPAGYRLKVPDRSTALHLAYMKSDPIQPPAAEQPASSTIYGGTTYKVRSGDTLLAISKKYGTSVAILKQLNGLTGNSVRVGQTLMVTRKENTALPPVRVASMPVVKPAVKAPVKQASSYRVKKGDTLWSLSIKLGVGINEIKAANKGNMVGNNLTVGKSIIIPK